MRVVMVEVGRKACEMELEDGLASMQRAVGGLIQAVYEPRGRAASCTIQTSVRKVGRSFAKVSDLRRCWRSTVQR